MTKFITSKKIVSCILILTMSLMFVIMSEAEGSSNKRNNEDSKKQDFLKNYDRKNYRKKLLKIGYKQEQLDDVTPSEVYNIQKNEEEDNLSDDQITLVKRTDEYYRIDKDGKRVKKEKVEALKAQDEFNKDQDNLIMSYQNKINKEKQISDNILNSKLFGLPSNWLKTEAKNGKESYYWMKITVGVARVASPITVAGRTYSSYYSYYTTYTWLTTPKNRLQDGFGTYVSNMMTTIVGSNSAYFHYTKKYVDATFKTTTPYVDSLGSGVVSYSSSWTGNAYTCSLPPADTNNKWSTIFYCNMWIDQAFKTVVSPNGSSGTATVVAQYAHMQSNFSPSMSISLSTSGSMGFSFNPSSWFSTTVDQVLVSQNIYVY